VTAVRGPRLGAELASGRHAYLVMAHTQFGTLERLLAELDDPRNDIYLHVDARATNFDPLPMKQAVQSSRLTLIDRMEVNWGSFSEIACELALLRAAVREPHNYYHLISGMDLPLRPQHEIHEFFAAHEGTEFVHLSPVEEVPATLFRVSTWHPLQERLGRGGRVVRTIAKALTRAQVMLRVNRLRRQKDIQIGFGSQWFSITHTLACDLLAQEGWIRNVFSSSQCGSELFVQTVVHRLPDFDRVAGTAMRKVDWERGDGAHPYIWRMADLPELQACDAMFARKFDARVDADVIDALHALLEQRRQSLTGRRSAISMSPPNSDQ
jgi:hypothetical protein